MTDAASATISSIAAARDARGRFQPGSSGNPAGKKPGTLNRATLLKRVMADGDDERIASLVVERALAGEWPALRLAFDRLEPRPRARPVALDFPEGATVAEMSEIVVRAMADAEISPDEAMQIMRLLEKVETQRRRAQAKAVVAAKRAAATRLVAAARSVATRVWSAPPTSGRAAAHRPADPPVAAQAPGANGRADGLHSTCILQP